MKVQKRRAVSLRPATYEAIAERAAAAGVSISEAVEWAISRELRRCSFTQGSFSCGAQAGSDGRCGRHPSAVTRAVAAVQREGDRQVDRIAAKLLPRESKIMVGPPPEQLGMLGREAPTPTGPRFGGVALW